MSLAFCPRLLSADSDEEELPLLLLKSDDPLEEEPDDDPEEPLPLLDDPLLEDPEPEDEDDSELYDELSSIFLLLTGEATFLVGGATFDSSFNGAKGFLGVCDCC